MRSKTRLITSCTKRHENSTNLVTSRKLNTRLARPIDRKSERNAITQRDCIPNCRNKKRCNFKGKRMIKMKHVFIRRLSDNIFLCNFVYIKSYHFDYRFSNLLACIVISLMLVSAFVL